jgi:hypothetical protein
MGRRFPSDAVEYVLRRCRVVARQQRSKSRVYFDSLTVVFGWALPCFAVTYRPEMAERYLPDGDEPRREPPPFLAAICLAPSWG